MLAYVLVTKEDAHLTCWLAQAGGAKQKAGIGIFGRKKSAWDGDGGGGGGGGAGVGGRPGAVLRGAGGVGGGGLEKHGSSVVRQVKPYTLNP
jgi:hypothetical protein